VRKNGRNGSSTLPWSVRYKVAIGIAEAMAYLHNGTERCVVHRDIKPSNILLSSKKAPKVRCFLPNQLQTCSLCSTDS
jgi:serine/threonine protein kinase